jgi:hypothetical protein
MCIEDKNRANHITKETSKRGMAFDYKIPSEQDVAS